jgi:hypothetical protein
LYPVSTIPTTPMPPSGTLFSFLVAFHTSKTFSWRLSAYCDPGIRNGALIVFLFYCLDLRYLLSIPPEEFDDNTRKGFLHGYSMLLDILTWMQGMDSHVRCGTTYHSEVSGADPGCLSRIRMFSIPDPESECFPPGSTSNNLSILTQKIGF